MAKQIKIKDIALMAGVSAGTVDRVLHRRGRVSSESREAVEKVLEEVGYRYNIHTSAISIRKEFRIAITIPHAIQGEYWGAIKDGFDHALEEYSDISMNCSFHFYDQFNADSCAEAFGQVLRTGADAVIIGPTFAEETAALCSGLDKTETPYIYVDSEISGTSPLATFTTDHYACGVLAAKILKMSMPEEGSMAIFEAERSDNKAASNAIARKEGFRSYMSQLGEESKLIYSSYSVESKEKNILAVAGFLSEHPDVKGISVLNSRGYLISEILRDLGRDDIRLISFDLTESNVRELENGHITALLCQRPQQQGFNAIKALINHLLYRNHEEYKLHLMPIDVIFKENLPYYKEIIKD